MSIVNIYFSELTTYFSGLTTYFGRLTAYVGKLERYFFYKRTLFWVGNAGLIVR